MPEHILELTIKESAGFDRHAEPLTFGVPLAQGLLREPSRLHIVDAEGCSFPCVGTTLAKWPDGSLKWLLLDTQLSIPALAEETFQVVIRSDETSKGQMAIKGALELSSTNDSLTVLSDKLAFELPTKGNLTPCSRVTISGRDLQAPKESSIFLTDQQGKVWSPQIDRWQLEVNNPIRIVVAYEGTFVSDSRSLPLRFICRCHFFAGKPLVRMDLTLWNPQADQHPGGVWDLGGSNSVLFKELVVKVVASGIGPFSCRYSMQPAGPLSDSAADLLIYQDSSGGENWRSHNHVNRNGEIPLRFQGYEIKCKDNLIEQGKRITPCVTILGDDVFVSATVRNFWGNFPKALEAHDNSIDIDLFPRHFSDLFELQGGERKTHTIYFQYGDRDNSTGRELDWVHAPILPIISPEHYYFSGACPKPLPPSITAADHMACTWQKMVDVAIQPGNSFFERKEIIDEYGWRNFGDIYGDHEAVFHKGPVEFVSHYNNQYDVIKGSLLQFMRSGNPAWFRLADDLARHVMDIDIYHTDQDRYQYNHGLFWHTDHHLDAATCTHRTHSKKHWDSKPKHLVGGGPGPAHNYATGLLYYYWFTGNPMARDSVLSLAQFVVNAIDGPDTLLQATIMRAKNTLKWIRRKLKGQTTNDFQQVYGLNGPGRGSGNSLNVLLDAYLVTADASFIERSEKLICRCVSPHDDIEARDLLNAETRWMYTIFLQALGRYCDVKLESGQLDAPFWYARSVLLKYALWMVQNEYPYMDKPEKLEFPNETWSAQEIRKSDVLAYAALYAPEELRTTFIEKSRFFFETCIKQLMDFPTRELTRIIVLLMTNGSIHLDVFNRLQFHEQMADKEFDFGITAKKRSQE